MNKTTSEENNTIIESDKYLSESGVQGGKIIGEHLSLGCFIMGIPFFIIGIYVLLNMFFGFGYPTNTAIIIGALLSFVIGLLLIIAGYSIRRAKHVKN
ncbi:Uncharacterised protein [uncultured archaeon]|nr:Uncharacterised protein [uncultured archaeon]